MKYLSKLLLIMVTTISIALLSGCSVFSTSEDSAKKTANLVYVNWAEGIAYTNVAKVVLEQKMGYEVEITSSDVDPAFQSIAEGSQDAFMEVWLPVLHKGFVDNYGDQIVDLTAVYDGTQCGLVVPQYVYDDGLTSLNNLSNPTFKSNLDSKIQEMNPGAGIMTMLNEVIVPEYSLEDYTILSVETTPIMLDTLDTAIDNNEWIVATLWKPHWAFAEWGLKFLDEPEGIWSEGRIHIFGRSGIAEDKPELKDFLEDMYLTNAQLSDLMLQFKNSEDSNEVIAEKWVEENEAVVQAWIP